jgi:hypothetical protein
MDSGPVTSQQSPVASRQKQPLVNAKRFFTQIIISKSFLPRNVCKEINYFASTCIWLLTGYWRLATGDW